MFTGLVQTLATVTDVRRQPPGKRLVVRAPELAAQTKVGDSIAVNGCCLTVVAVDDALLHFEAGPETLARTNLGELAADCRVNLEASLRVGDSLGGHLVTGHIDGLGTLLARDEEGEWAKLWFSAARPDADDGLQGLGRGGRSEPDPGGRGARAFSRCLIPHTLASTTLGQIAPGGRVNLETDLIGKYVQKLVDAAGYTATASPPKDR